VEKRIDNEMQRQQFVAEASRILAESIDYEATLQSVAQLAVPDIADWCVVDLVQDDGSMARVAIAHKDRSRQPAAAELKRRYPPVRDATVGARFRRRSSTPSPPSPTGYGCCVVWAFTPTSALR
jgi:hypothetical protein